MIESPNITKIKNDYFDYTDQIIVMHLDEGNLNNQDADQDDTPFFEHNTARVSIFEDEGLAQSAFNIFNHEPRQSKQKSFISKLDIFERGNGDIEQKHRSITSANEFIPMTGGRQFHERQSGQNSKQKQLFQSRARDTKDKDKPFYLKKQSLEKEKFTFRPLSSTNISFQGIHEKNLFQGPDSNISRKSSKEKEQQFHYMRVESTFNERPVFKKQDNLVNKQTKLKEREEHVVKESKESEQRSKLNNINIKDIKELKELKEIKDLKDMKDAKDLKGIKEKDKDSNQNSTKMNFISNLRKSRAEQKGPGFKLSTQNVFKDSKPSPITTNANQNQEHPSKKIEEISPKGNIKLVQNVSKTAIGFGEFIKKSFLDVNPTKTEKKFIEPNPNLNPDNTHVKTSNNFNKLPSLASSRVKAFTTDGLLSDSSSNQSLPKDKIQNQKVQNDENKNKKISQITEAPKEDNKGFVLGLKDKLKAFGGPTEKMQMKSIANSKGFQFKPKNMFNKESVQEPNKSTKIQIQPEIKPSIAIGSKFDIKQKEIKPSKIPEVIQKRESKLQPSFPANRSDFSKYMVDVTMLLVQSEKVKIRCNRTKNVFRELSILSNAINEKINKVIQTN